MSRIEKTIERLLSKPKDFTWNEAVRVMKHFGYRVINKKGSRRRFYHDDLKKFVSIHEPHPHNELREYQLDLLIDRLKEDSFI